MMNAINALLLGNAQKKSPIWCSSRCGDCKEGSPFRLLLLLIPLRPSGTHKLVNGGLEVLAFEASTGVVGQQGL